MYVEVFNRGVIPLAYSIRKRNKAGETNTYLDGIYLLFTYFTKPESIEVLDQTLKTDDDVIRSTSFKIRKRKYQFWFYFIFSSFRRKTYIAKISYMYHVILYVLDLTSFPIQFVFVNIVGLMRKEGQFQLLKAVYQNPSACLQFVLQFIEMHIQQKIQHNLLEHHIY